MVPLWSARADRDGLLQAAALGEVRSRAGVLRQVASFLRGWARMQERPAMIARSIVLTAREVRGLRDGSITQLRRLVKPQPHRYISSLLEILPGEGDWKPAWSYDPAVDELPDDEMIAANRVLKCPYGKPGDALWVRETGYWFEQTVYHGGRLTFNNKCVYKADGGTLLNEAHWKSAIHMPRWASRLTLELEEVRVQRVQEITEEDARSEGFDFDDAEPPDGFGEDGRPTALAELKHAWVETHGAESRDRDWVWALTVRVSGEA
jgi:hypothetical protein